MPHQPATPIPVGDSDSRRMRQMLIWLGAIVVGLIPLDILMGVALGAPAFLYQAVALAIFLPSILLAAWLTRRGRLRGAALAISAGIQLPALIMVVIMPPLTAAIVVVPVMAQALLLPFLTPRDLAVGSIGTVVLSVGFFLVGTLLPPVLPSPGPLVSALYGALGVGLIVALTMLLLWQHGSRLIGMLAETQGANAALEAARAGLEATVAARTAELRRALDDVELRAATQAQLLRENAQQREAIREMSVPVLPISDGAIVIPLVGMLDGGRLEALQQQALAAVQQSRARHVLLDITGVPLVDTHVARGLLTVVQSARLLGAEAVLVGVRPEVAQTIVALGIDMRAIRTRQTLQEGIAYAVRAEPHRAAAV